MAVPTLDIRPVTGTIGAEVHGLDLALPLDLATVDAVWAALGRHEDLTRSMLGCSWIARHPVGV